VGRLPSRRIAPVDDDRANAQVTHLLRALKLGCDGLTLEIAP
jgi:hypothetical protein